MNWFTIIFFVVLMCFVALAAAAYTKAGIAAGTSSDAEGMARDVADRMDCHIKVHHTDRHTIMAAMNGHMEQWHDDEDENMHLYWANIHAIVKHLPDDVKRQVMLEMQSHANYDEIFSQSEREYFEQGIRWDVQRVNSLDEINSNLQSEIDDLLRDEVHNLRQERAVERIQEQVRARLRARRPEPSQTAECGCGCTPENAEANKANNPKPEGSE